MHIWPRQQVDDERCASSALVTVYAGSSRAMPSSQLSQWSSDVRSLISGSAIGSRSFASDAMSGCILPPDEVFGSLAVTALPRMQ